MTASRVTTNPAKTCAEAGETTKNKIKTSASKCKLKLQAGSTLSLCNMHFDMDLNIESVWFQQRI